MTSFPWSEPSRLSKQSKTKTKTRRVNENTSPERMCLGMYVHILNCGTEEKPRLLETKVGHARTS